MRGRWGVVTNVSPLEVRFDGDVIDTPVGLVNADITVADGDKVALDQRGNEWVVAYRMEAS